LFFAQIATVLQAVNNKAMVRLFSVIFHRVELHYVSHGETWHPC